MSTTDADARTMIDDEIEKIEGSHSIEELAAEYEEEDSGQQLLDFGDTLNLTVKGSKPSDSEIKIKAISRPIKGQLGDSNDDEVVQFLVTGRLDEVRMVSKRDGDGKVVAKARRHVITPISVFPVTSDQADQLLGLE